MEDKRMLGDNWGFYRDELKWLSPFFLFRAQSKKILGKEKYLKKMKSKLN